MQEGGRRDHRPHFVDSPRLHPNHLALVEIERSLAGAHGDPTPDHMRADDRIARMTRECALIAECEHRDCYDLVAVQRALSMAALARRRPREHLLRHGCLYMRLVEDRGEYKLYECFIDGTFSKAKGGGATGSASRRPEKA